MAANHERRRLKRFAANLRHKFTTSSTSPLLRPDPRVLSEDQIGHFTSTATCSRFELELNKQIRNADPLFQPARFTVKRDHHGPGHPSKSRFRIIKLTPVHRKTPHVHGQAGLKARAAKH